jgi:hypothetical protein
MFITAIIALIYRQRFGDSPIKYIPYYLVYISLVEIGALIILYSPMKYNIWWYNIMLNGEFFFYFYLYYHLISNPKIKKVLLLGFIFYIIYFLINYLILSEHWNVHQTFPYAVGSIIIIISVFWYLIELFQSDKVLDITQNIIFWISVGLLFYLIVSLPKVISNYYLSKIEYINNPIAKISMIVQFIANITMYCFYIYGIWISKPQKS